MIPFIQRKQRHNANYGTRRSLIPYPRNTNILTLGNSHTRQIFTALACQYQDAIVQSEKKELDEERELIFSLGPNANLTFTLLVNHPAFYSKRWKANLEEILHRPLKDFDALIVGKFNYYKPEFSSSKQWTTAREYAEKNPRYEVELDRCSKGIPFENLLGAYQGPLVYMSMMAEYGDREFQQGLQIIEMANRTNSVHVVNARDHVDEPEFMQRECAYPGSGPLVEDCVETKDGNRCFGDKGGESDIAAYEVVEELWDIFS